MAKPCSQRQTAFRETPSWLAKSAWDKPRLRRACIKSMFGCEGGCVMCGSSLLNSDGWDSFPRTNKGQPTDPFWSPGFPGDICRCQTLSDQAVVPTSE